MKIEGIYRCCNCGCTFREDEIHYEDEPRGEFWGQPCYETMSYSPCCESDFEEYEINGLYKCKDCGKVYDVDDLTIEVEDGEVHLSCPDCLGDVVEYVEV